MSTHTSRADVATDNPRRYAKQLVAHLGREIPFTAAGDAAWSAQLGDGTARIVVGAAVLTLHAEAPDPESPARVEHVLGSHLERFGQRDELAGAWHPTRVKPPSDVPQPGPPTPAGLAAR